MIPERIIFVSRGITVLNIYKGRISEVQETFTWVHTSRPDWCTYLRWDVRSSSLFSHECRKVCRARVSYCRRLGFKCWTGSRVTWLKLLALFLSSCIPIPGQNLKLGKECFLPHSFYISIHYLTCLSILKRGRNSSVGTATRYILNDPGFEGRWGNKLSFLHTRMERLSDPPSLLYNEYRLSLLGIKRPVREANHLTPSSTEVDSPLRLQGILRIFNLTSCWPGSVVGIATAYGLDGPGIESPVGQDFPHQSRPALRPTQPPVQWVPGLSRG